MRAVFRRREHRITGSARWARIISSLTALSMALLLGQGQAGAEPAAVQGTRCADGYCIDALQQDVRGATSATISRRTGTAWLSESGYLVTSLHVVNGQDRIVVISALGARYSARIVASDAANDIAILSFPGDRRTAQGMRTAVEPVRLGSAVSFVGYPMTSVLGRQPKVQAGVVFGRDGPRDDPRHMQISAHALAGHSGSPVLDDEATVIGMIVGRLTLPNGQDIPQLALAVKVEHVASLLNRLHDTEGASRHAGVGDTPAARRSRNAGEFTESVFLVLSDSIKKESSQ